MSDPRDLITGYLDDSLSTAERQELLAWLKERPDHLRRFVEENQFNESLRDAVRSLNQREAAEAFSPSRGALPRLRASAPSRPWFGGLFAAPTRLLFAGVVALGLTLLALTLLYRPALTTEKASWARVAQTRSAQFSLATPPLQPGRWPTMRRIVLLAGAVELELRNGVTIVFEGPGDLELVSPMRALLHAGQAVVRVPDAARGFQLETANAQVVDLGTEFGVKCGPGGASDVLVFDGKVVASASGGSSAFPRELTAGSATRFAPGQPNPTAIAYRPERFVRRLPADRPVELDEPGSQHFNQPRFESLTVPRPERPVAVDGDLSEWTGAGSFRSVRNGSAGEFVEGRMRYDEEFLYVAAHIGDPAPMRNVVDPATDGELGWRGGSLQVRVATDPARGWPAEGNSAAYYTMRRLTTDAAQVSRATDPRLVHLTLWHHAPSAQNCLHAAYGMDFHGGVVNPAGYRAAFRKDADGRGYTLEYAIPWKLLNAPHPPRPGDTLAMSWTVHWSDEGGRLWRGQLVELRNASEPLRIHTWERAATWGRALFR